MSPAPVLSAIIPTYNAGHLVADAIGSILDQDLPRLEVVVIDDGSTDDTDRVVAGFGDPVVYERRPNAGPAAARNRGIEVARSDVLAFCDADDLWTQGRLGPMFHALDSDVGVVLGSTRYLDMPSAERAQYRFRRTDDVAVIPSFGAALVCRSAFARVGPIDESMDQYEDYDWFLRAREVGVGLVTIDHVVQEYRRRPDSFSQEAPRAEEALLSTLKRSLERRRAAGSGPARDIDDGVSFG